MKKILVPTDFSEHAAYALSYAVALANAIDASLYILHACWQFDERYTRYRHLIQEHNARALQEAKNKMTALKENITKAESLKIETCIFNGEVQETILYFSQREHIDLIVMGTKGSSGLSAIMGSVTAGIIQRSTIPVLVIPKEYRWNEPTKILFATKHFEEKQHILEPVVFFADLFNAKVSVAKFTDEDTAETADYIENAELLIGYMKKLKKNYNTLQIEAQHLSGSELEETLQQHISNDGVDMLAMVTYQRSLLERLFSPSSTKKMATYTKVPLMIIPFNDEFTTKNINNDN